MANSIKRTIKVYYEQLYAHKVDNLDETEKFLEKHILTKPTQEEIDNWIDLSLLKKLSQ